MKRVALGFYLIQSAASQRSKSQPAAGNVWVKGDVFLAEWKARQEVTKASAQKSSWGVPEFSRQNIHLFDDDGARETLRVEPVINEAAQQLLWVHIPKTGSTFCLSLAHQRCPARFEATCHSQSETFLMAGCARLSGLEQCEVATIKDHGPVTPSYLPGGPKEAKLVIMMRRPRDRVVSMFADSRHSVGLEKAVKAEMEIEMANQSAVACRSIRRSRPQFPVCVAAASFRVFLRQPTASSCVVSAL